MHSSIHTLAHRAPPATRTRVRWQPYNALSASSSSRSPTLSTPATSVLPSPTPKATPLCETERLKAQSSMPQTPRDPSGTRENPKTKYATGLVDQAVKSLCEIWRPQDIPNVFLTSSRATVGSEIPPPPQSRCNAKLPSPVAPLAHGSPACSRAGPSGLQCDSDRNNLVPIKGFVHEVLRRSRTSGSVLQTALCYLEAVRPKVPELIRKEHSGEGTRTEFDADTRVMPATPAELEQEARWAEIESAASAFDVETPAADYPTEADSMDTVRISDEDLACTATPFTAVVAADSLTPQKATSTTTLSTPAPLPSPLLCPRRAFLASLILASKFTQDKCYSNRAWAKLSGLPAREIGRCERALGDALEWRLWVGKTLPTSQGQAPSPTTPAPVANSRPVARCQSESSLSFSKGTFLPRNDKKDYADVSSAATSSPTSSRRPLRRLGMSATLPAEAFSGKGRPAGYESSWNGEGHQLSFSNIAQQDQLMGSPEYKSIDSPSTPSSYSSQQSSSPSMSTPGLSYSPSSTESSSGDRTIQMSSFMDDNMSMVPQHDSVFVAGSNDLALQGSWGAVAPSSPTLTGIAFEAALAHASYTSSEYPAKAKWGELAVDEFGAASVGFLPAMGYPLDATLAAQGGTKFPPARTGLPPLRLAPYQ